MPQDLLLAMYLGNSMIYTSEYFNFNSFAIVINMAHRLLVAYMLTARLINSSSVCTVRLHYLLKFCGPIAALSSRLSLFSKSQSVLISHDVFIAPASSYFVVKGANHVDVLPRSPASVHSDENRRSLQSHGFRRVQARVGVTGIRPALIGALDKYSDIVTVDAGDGKQKYWWRF